jgi:hypothetical protein
MNLIEIPAMGVLQFSAIAVIVITGLALVATLVFLAIGIFQQSKYDNNALPTFAELNPEAEESIIEIDDEEVMSVFKFEDDDLDSEPIGDTAADEILKDMRAVEAAPERTKKFGLFGGSK